MQGLLRDLILSTNANARRRHWELQVHGIETTTHHRLESLDRSRRLSPKAILAGRLDPQQIKSAWTTAGRHALSKPWQLGYLSWTDPARGMPFGFHLPCQPFSLFPLFLGNEVGIYCCDAVLILSYHSIFQWL